MEKDVIRVHPIITDGGSMVNAIPEKTVLESYVRGMSFDAIKDANDKVNRALAAGALAMGANIATFAGLSGLGDLIVTATSTLSRNYTAGKLIGKGMDLNTVLQKVHMVVEGVNTATAAYGLGKKYSVETPIIEQAYSVLYNGVDPKDAVNTLMTRQKTSE